MSFVSETSNDWIMIIQVLITMVVARYYYKYFTRPSPLPGPFPLPLIGNLFRVGLNPTKYAMDHRKEFGDMFELWVGSRRFIHLSHPSLLDQVYLPSVTTKFFKRFHFPSLERAGMHHGLIFNDDYQTWKRNRKFVVQSLMSPRFLGQFTHLTQSLFNENERFWDKNEYHVDLVKWVKSFTTDITLQTITRKPSYCLHTYFFGEEHHDPIKSKEIQRSLKFNDAVQTFIHYLVFLTFIPDTLKDYFPGFYHLNKKYEKNTDWINETISDIIKERRTEIERLPNDGKGDSDLIDLLLTLNTPLDPNRDEEEAPLSDQEIRSTLMEVSVAGTDTIGNTFCYAVWQLARHPKVLARFQEEIGKVLGDDTLRQVTYEDLGRFTYLDAILKESQRVIPIVPLMARTSTQDCDVGGKHWEADTIFFIGQEQIHQLPDCWKDPDQFIPERFLKESDYEIVKNSYLPFGGGIRVCPGRHMAMVEVKTLLILLFRKYDVELVDKVSKNPKIKYIGTNDCIEMKVIVRPKKRVDV